ncbi:hypothetical protein Xsto_03847 [Xenorhabdus stockiae]|uniref:Uncharacterized protein n=1 Tax=Xenorhabdus stockiae TaxID=351614 RepID=A0A2D0KAY6_9GAMM|nr:hypothetical protein [Xenorhabdus stockiae]PHM60591.1 hypothetical protein Xsto_03847 [Xenorhabdus stockiae]
MATITVTHDDIFTEVRKYLIALFSCDVMQGYQNDVPVAEGGSLTGGTSGKKLLDGTSYKFNMITNGAEEIA